MSEDSTLKWPEGFPADHITWHGDATLQNFRVSNIVIGSFTLHINPDGSLEGKGNADGAAQSFFDNVVALHNAKLHELQTENHARGVLLGRILQRCYDTSYKDKGHVCTNRQTVESIVQMIEANTKEMARNSP